jgi:hypothetical protein
MHNFPEELAVLIRSVEEKLIFVQTKQILYVVCNIKHVQKNHGVVIIISYLIKTANQRNMLQEVTKSTFIKMELFAHIKFNFQVDLEKVINLGFISICFTTSKPNL